MLPIFTAVLPLVTDSSTDFEPFESFAVFNMGDDIMLHEVKLSFLDRQMKWNDEAAIEDTAAQIEHAEKVEVLELRGNTLGVSAGDRLARALERRNDLKRCLWSDLFTGRLKTEIPPILKTLCKSMIMANTRLVELDLSDNAFGPIGAEGIQDFLVSPSAYSLEILKLNNCGLGPGGKVIANCLTECWEKAYREGQRFALKTFVAGRNRLEDVGAQALSLAFQKIKTLEHIAIPQNGIRVAGVMALAQAFKANRNLRVININDNTCTAAGGVALSLAISDLQRLEILDLGDCLCRDKGGIAIITAIYKENFPNLQTVDLSGNELTTNAAYVAVEAWKEMGIAAKLNLSTNSFGQKFRELWNTLRDEACDELIDLGDESDDEGTLSEQSGIEYDTFDEDFEEDQEHYSDEEADEEVENVVTLDTPAKKDEGIESLLSGVGCMKMNAEAVPVVTSKVVPLSDSETTLSFLDKQYKWNDAESVKEAALRIREHYALHTLELRGNTLGIEAGGQIADALKNHPELERCLWSDLFTGRLRSEIPPIVKSLCSAMISAFAQIVELDLSDNAFGPVGAESIQDFLTSHSAYSLHTLKLNNCGLGAGGKVIASSLIECHKRSVAAGRPLQLKIFVAGRNRLEVPGAIALAEAFKIIGTLEEITMYQNGITAKGVSALAGAFKVNRNLRKVDISDNTATEEGSRAIAQAMPSLAQLEELLLGDCLCRDAGCHAIVDALSPAIHQKLKSVDLSGSEMSGNAALQISAKFKKFSGQATLKIEANNFGHLFERIRQQMPTYVICGDSEDDQGSLSDTEELRSEPDSEDEEDEEQLSDKENAANSAFAPALSMLDQLAAQYDSRSQEETAIYLLSLIDIVAKNPDNENLFRRAVDLAEDVVVRVEAALRRPVPPSTMLVNQLIAQAGFVKPESKLVPFVVDKNALKKVLDALIERNRLQKEKETIEFYYRKDTPKPAHEGAKISFGGGATKNPFSFSFNLAPKK